MNPPTLLDYMPPKIYEQRRDIIITTIDIQKKYKLPSTYYGINSVLYLVNDLFSYDLPFEFAFKNNYPHSFDVLIFLILMSGEFPESFWGFGTFIMKYSKQELQDMIERVPAKLKKNIEIICKYISEKTFYEINIIMLLSWIMVRENIWNEQEALAKLHKYQSDCSMAMRKLAYKDIIDLLSQGDSNADE